MEGQNCMNNEMKLLTTYLQLSGPNHPPLVQPAKVNRRLTSRFVIRVGVAALLCLGLNAGAGELRVQQLRCEYLENPVGIDATTPRLSWIVTSDRRAEQQTAYQILVASSATKLKANDGNLWDSGKVPSNETVQIHYAGQPLQSSQQCFWKVRAWDKNGEPSSWSKPAVWEMGLLAAGDWQAQWIGRTTDTNSQPAPLLRRKFELPEQVKRATVYVCGLGYYELHLNGKQVGHRLLDPGYTRYDKRVLYATYDVTAQLKRGPNALGVILGNGWYNVHTKAVWNFHEAPWRAAPKLLLQLRLEYSDGRVENIVSDNTWKTSTGPIVYDSIYGGETYDARLEKPGWDTPGFNDTDWQPALIVEAPKGKLVAQMMPPIRVEERSSR